MKRKMLTLIILFVTASAMSIFTAQQKDIETSGVIIEKIDRLGLHFMLDTDKGKCIVDVNDMIDYDAFKIGDVYTVHEYTQLKWCMIFMIGALCLAMLITLLLLI